VQTTLASSDSLGEFIDRNMPAWEQRQASYDQLVGAFGSAGAVDRSGDVMLAAGPGYNGGLDSDSQRNENIARMLRLANERGAMGSEPFRVEINGVGSTGAADMAPTKANAMRLGLMGPDGQTEGTWSSPVAQSNVVGVPLSPLGSSVMGPSLPELDGMSYGEQMRNVGKFFGDIGMGAARGLVNVVPETLAFGYRMTGYAAAGMVSLVDTDWSDKMFARYERVTGRILDYDNGLQEASGLVSGLVGPANALRGAAVAGDLAHARLATAIRTDYQFGWSNFVTSGVDVAGNPSALSSPVAQALRGELIASGRPMAFVDAKTEEIIKSGLELPTMRNANTGEFFYKLQPLDAGGNPLNSVYWMNSCQYARVQGTNAAEIGNVMGLPAPSTARGAFNGFQVYETTPRLGTSPLVFESQIAPITQGSNYSARGLDYQTLIANPKVWYPARPIGAIPGVR
jgi:hypothetical protein